MYQGSTHRAIGAGRRSSGPNRSNRATLHPRCQVPRRGGGLPTHAQHPRETGPVGWKAWSHGANRKQRHIEGEQHSRGGRAVLGGRAAGCEALEAAVVGRTNRSKWATGSIHACVRWAVGGGWWVVAAFAFPAVVQLVISKLHGRNCSPQIAAWPPSVLHLLHPAPARSQLLVASRLLREVGAAAAGGEVVNSTVESGPLPPHSPNPCPGRSGNRCWR